MDQHKLEVDELRIITKDMIENGGKEYKKLLHEACYKRGLDSDVHSINLSTGEIKRVA